MATLEFAVYNPDAIKANIHGFVAPDGGHTCAADENGTLCDGCCTAGYVPEIEIADEPMGKLPGVECPFACGGCGLVAHPEKYAGIERPQRCGDYECGKDRQIVIDPSKPMEERTGALQRMTISNLVAFNKGQITSTQYIRNLDKHIPENPRNPS